MTNASISLPEYWLPRPAPALSPSARQQCDALLREMVAAGPAHMIAYSLEVPKWQFLCHVAEHHPIALHGSNRSGIARFEPRQPVDLHAFGAQNAVYAASDGIWPLYFAVVDRRHVHTLVNACVRVRQPGAVEWTIGPLYVFSISLHTPLQQAYTRGVVYLLPSDSFQPEPPFVFGSLEVSSAQLASPQAVEPLACLEVEPEDFPFLGQMRRHDDNRLADYAAAMQGGTPWPDV